MASAVSEQFQPDSLATKVMRVICCETGPCKDCCDCDKLLGKKPSTRLRKADIRHIVNTQPCERVEPCRIPGPHQEWQQQQQQQQQQQEPQASPAPSRDSISSRSSRSSRSSWSFEVTSFRERYDSDSSSRKGSTSSSADHKRTTPVIDMKPIEFWAANRENVQPRAQPKRRLLSESDISIDELQLDLYETPPSTPDQSLTDEQKLARFKLGQVHFSVQYDISTSSLIVRMIEARELPHPCSYDGSRQDMAHSNPYVRLCLLPDSKNARQTSVQRKTQEPHWDELFRFELPFAEVQRRTLEVTVKDFDKFSRHCVTGQMHLPLEGVNLVKGGHMWKPLLPCTKDTCDLGELLLSLNYLPTAGRLNVDVIKAKQLIQTDVTGGPDSCVKVTLCHIERVVKTKKTSVKRGVIDPVFNETLSFNVTPDQLLDVTLVVTVLSRTGRGLGSGVGGGGGGIGGDDSIGRVLMGRQATGPQETTHWTRMIQCQRTPVAQWHTLLARRECDRKCSLSSFIS